MQHHIINELRTLKERYNLSYDKLGKVLDLPSNTVYRWLKSGRITPLYAEALQERIKAYYAKKDGISVPKEAKDDTGTT